MCGEAAQMPLLATEDICRVSAADIFAVSTADICPVPTGDIVPVSKEDVGRQLAVVIFSVETG